MSDHNHHNFCDQAIPLRCPFGHDVGMSCGSIQEYEEPAIAHVHQNSVREEVFPGHQAIANGCMEKSRPISRNEEMRPEHQTRADGYIGKTCPLSIIGMYEETPAENEALGQGRAGKTCPISRNDMHDKMAIAHEALDQGHEEKTCLISRKNMHGKRPPTHQALADEYTGKTCPISRRILHEEMSIEHRALAEGYPRKTCPISQNNVHGEMPLEHQALADGCNRKACPISRINTHEEIPPEHQELVRGCTGKTCPISQDTMREEMPSEHQVLANGHTEKSCPISRNNNHKEMSSQHQASAEGYTGKACPISRDSMHEEMPPEHQALAEGYTGKTCPFLDTGEDLNDDEGIKSPNPLTLSSDHDRENSILVEENDDTIREDLNMQQHAEPQCRMPQTASEAREKMNEIMEAQREARDAVDQAKEEIIRAQNHLSLVEAHQETVDKIVTESAEGLIDLLLKEDSSWNKMYRKLEEYKKLHGHCDVKRNQSKDERAANPHIGLLAQWVGKTRTNARKPLGHPEKIEPYQIIALNRLGFDWSPRDNAWYQNYEKLKKYMKQNPGNLPQRRKDPLGTWCNGQIVEYNKFMAGNTKAYITQKKIDLLNEIGFIWNRASSKWLQRYEALKSFREKFGHCRLPKTYEDQALYRWVTKERIKYRNFIAKTKPSHTEDQWNMLKDIGFMEGDRIPVLPKKRKRELKNPQVQREKNDFGCNLKAENAHKQAFITDSESDSSMQSMCCKHAAL